MKKLIFLLALSAFGQYPLTVTPWQAIYTNGGVAVPCSNCYVYTYFAGTNNAQNTYTSYTLGTALPNPIRTNSAGYAVSGSNAITGVWVSGTACYHLVFKNSSAVTVWEQDNVCNPAAIATNLQILLAGPTGAAQIGYKYSSSATQRTVQSRLRDEASSMDFGCVRNGATSDVACLRAVLGINGIAVSIVPGSYGGGTAIIGTPISVLASSVYAEGAIFVGGFRFSTAAAVNGLSWVGGTVDASTAVTGTGTEIFMLAHDHQSLIDTRFIFGRNYTAIQICSSSPCPTDVNIDGLETTANGQSHITMTGGKRVRINNWNMDGTGGEAGLALLSNTDDIDGVSVSNVTAVNTASMLQLAGSAKDTRNVSYVGGTCTNCSTGFESQIGSGGAGKYQNIAMSKIVMIDVAGTHMTNAILISNTNTAQVFSNLDFEGWQVYGARAINPASSATSQDISIISTHSAVMDHVRVRNFTLNYSTAGGGFVPTGNVYLQNNGTSTNFEFSGIDSNGSYTFCFQSNGMAFSTPKDLWIHDNRLSGCSTNATTATAYLINARSVFENNVTTLNASQPELSPASGTTPNGFSYAEITANTKTGTAPGGSVFCYDCTAQTPPASGGVGATCTQTTGPIWNCGGNPLICTALTFAGSADALTTTGACTLVDGLLIQGRLNNSVSLSTGASTLDYNGGGTISIKKATNPANNIGVGFVANSVLTLTYDAAAPAWVVNSQ